ncbi:hypothetical protein BTUL_0287g00030 [Botrytis tulipae]|uniref:Uncharacterized protein n=1 Tax=Botrytis tulipae TaxID=87230 RepID=A0A4Z1E9A7_9HELO|nr:hypothetical protein BTUL_0287g00030 [Botrytis tulipae]
MRLPRFVCAGRTPDNHQDTDGGVEENGDADSDVDAYAQPFEGIEEIEIEEERKRSGGYEGVAEQCDGL